MRFCASHVADKALSVPVMREASRARLFSFFGNAQRLSQEPRTGSISILKHRRGHFGMRSLSYKMKRDELLGGTAPQRVFGEGRAATLICTTYSTLAVGAGTSLSALYRVVAYDMGGPLDLKLLQEHLQSEGRTSTYREAVLTVGEPETDLETRPSRIFYFKSGQVVFWRVEEEEQLRFRQVACAFLSSSEKSHSNVRNMLRLGQQEDAVEYLPLSIPAPATTEGKCTTQLMMNGTLRLGTSENSELDKLAVASALASAVWLKVLQNAIEQRLENEFTQEIFQSWKQSSFRWYATTANTCIEELFTASRQIHEMRNILISQPEFHEIPDFLWDFDNQERLFSQVQRNFDIAQRIRLLNYKLTSALEHISCLSAFAEHKHGARLEKIIILLIFMELCLAIRNELKTMQQ